MKILYAILCLGLAGCATARPKALQRLSALKLQSPGNLPRMEAVQPPPPIRTITLAWTNELNWPATWSTGIEGTVDFTRWYEMARFAFKTGESRVTLTNRPAAEFYRAFNSAH